MRQKDMPSLPDGWAYVWERSPTGKSTNIITGLADAHYDSIPLVCFTGQVPLGLIGNDAFQEVDIVGMTRSITKYGVTVRRREDLGKIIKMAFYIAQTGKPGPVLIDIPKDIQTASGSAEYPSHVVLYSDCDICRHLQSPPCLCLFHIVYPILK